MDISGIDKAILLHTLWEKSLTLKSMYYFNRFAPFTRTQATEAVQRGYIDYFYGVSIKTDLREDIVESRLFNRDYGFGGFGRFAYIVNRIRDQMDTDEYFFRRGRFAEDEESLFGEE